MPARPLRRFVAVLACSACLLLLPQAASSLPARGGQEAGEPGSGPPTWSTAVTRDADGALATTEVRWSDVPNSLWARNAIDFVGATNDWMLDGKPDADGRYAFQPDRRESRRLFARALFRAFGKGLQQDAGLAFPDLPSDDRFYRFANTVVTAGWMKTDDQGAFRPTDPVTTREVHRAIVLAIGFGDLAAGADALHLRDGTKIDTPKDFGTTLIGMRIGLRYNHGDESLDVGPDEPLSRAEVAWSLFRAANRPSWLHDSLSQYATMTLPNLTPKMQRVVSFAVRYVGYPYVWGGDWDQPTSTGYCCGYQPVGGFDCSGLTWWVMKQAVKGWDPTPPREYKGWDLPQRTSASMAGAGTRVRWDDKRPGDLMFYDGNDDGTVDHVDTFIGGGWAIDSGGSNAGVTLTWISNNWYEDHFVRGRHILG
jgi:cell wall-associated NlpC family hydrolase